MGPKLDCWLDPQRNRSSLVLGYQGTLRADPAFLPEGYSADAVPGCMAGLVEPLLRAAVCRLEARTAEPWRRFCGEAIRLDSVIRTLSDRLCGILTQAVAEHSEDLAFAAADVLRQFPLLEPLLRQAAFDWVAAAATFLESASGRTASVGMAGFARGHVH